MTLSLLYIGIAVVGPFILAIPLCFVEKKLKKDSVIAIWSVLALICVAGGVFMFFKEDQWGFAREFGAIISSCRAYVSFDRANEDEDVNSVFPKKILLCNSDGTRFLGFGCTLPSHPYEIIGDIGDNINTIRTLIFIRKKSEVVDHYNDGTAAY